MMRCSALFLLVAACGADPSDTDPSTADTATDPTTAPTSTGATGSPTNPTTPTSSTTSTSSSTSLPATLPSCSGGVDPALDCDGPPSCGYFVDLEIVAEIPPLDEMTGGALLDGVYVLVAYRVWDPSMVPTVIDLDVEQVIVLDAGEMRGNAGGGGIPFSGYRGLYDTSSGEFVTTTMCPNGSGLPDDGQAYAFDGVIWRLLGGPNGDNEYIYAYLGPA